MFESRDFEDNAFLPEENDKLKAQIKELQRRLEIATKKERNLRRQLIEEDLSYVTVSKLTKLIQDPTKTAAIELSNMQKEILEKLMYTAEVCCVREIISYHRLSGRSIFTFKGNHHCIRLETYYRKTYKEPYYIVYNPNNSVIMQKKLIEHHTIPAFIHLDSLENQFLPHSFNTFIRIIHHQLQAYVSKREMMKEVGMLENIVEIIYQSESLHNVEFQLVSNQDIRICLFYKDKSSHYPTDVDIKASQFHDYFYDIQQEFKQTSIKDALVQFNKLATSVSGNNNNHSMEID